MTEKNDPLAYTQPTPTELGEKLDLILERMTRVEHLRAVELQPGDVFVYSTPQRVSNESVDRLIAHFAQHFPEQRVLVVDGGATLGLIKFPAMAEEEPDEEDRPELDLEGNRAGKPRDTTQPL